METIRLTQYSRGGGCGCKIAPNILEEILHTKASPDMNKKLIVGNNSNDDAAVYDIGGQYIISTTDFFTPIVDDAYDFGRIASANAISDIYAMGGDPLLAIAILGWPVEKLPSALAQKVLEGARAICEQAGIPLAGGHSINIQEPIFGLAVSGMVKPNHLKKNNTAQEGNLIYLTKKIGVGILATAEKKNILKDEHKGVAVKQMVQLNSLGAELGKLDYITAMTDVTGFGLLGHLVEMAKGSGIQAELNYSNVPIIDGLEFYTAQTCVPGNTFRNWNSYEKNVDGVTSDALFTLCDPQTNGGLLIAVDAKSQHDFEKFLNEKGMRNFAQPIGKMVNNKTKTITVL